MTNFKATMTKFDSGVIQVQNVVCCYKPTDG